MSHIIQMTDDEELNKVINDCFWICRDFGNKPTDVICKGYCNPCIKIIDSGKCDTLKEYFQKQREKE